MSFIPKVPWPTWFPERLNALRYEPDLGRFFHTPESLGRNQQDRVGMMAGRSRVDHTGYRLWEMSLRGGGGKKIFRCSDAVWFKETGAQPPHQLDHRDGDSLNDRFSNLRLPPSPSHQQMNQKVHRDNRLGQKGIWKNQSGSYQVCIWVPKAQIVDRRWYGHAHHTLAAAIEERDALVARFHGDWARRR